MIAGILRVVQGIVKLRGGTDLTIIGNTGDKLKVDSSGATSEVPTLLSTNKLYSAAFDASAAVSNTNNPILLFRNPAASGKVLKIWRIRTDSDVTNVALNARIYANPTITLNGTSVSAFSRNVGGGAASAVALVTSLPTLSVLGSLLEAWVNGQNSNSFDGAPDFSMAIQENNSILLTINPSSNNRNCVVSIIWSET